MDIINENNKKIFKGVFALILYFCLISFSTLPFKIFNVSVSSVSENIGILYSAVFNILVFCTLVILYYDTLKKDFVDILENHKNYYSKGIKYWLIGVAVMILSNFIIVVICKNGLGNNEATVRTISQFHPIYMYLSSVILAPMAEELIYRQSFRNIFGKNLIFVIISGFVFASVHVVSNASTTLDMFMLIPYSAIGISFAYMLYKFDNIFVSIGFHMMHNGLLMAFQFLILFFL